jgi:hypothetical protein
VNPALLHLPAAQRHRAAAPGGTAALERNCCPAGAPGEERRVVEDGPVVVAEHVAASEEEAAALRRRLSISSRVRTTRFRQPDHRRSRDLDVKEGKVDGNTITFKVGRSGQPLTEYKGELNGSELILTRQSSTPSPTPRPVPAVDAADSVVAAERQPTYSARNN